MLHMQFDLQTAQRLLRDPTIQIPTIAALFNQTVAVFAKYYKRHTERSAQAADGSHDPNGHNYGDYRAARCPDGPDQGCRLELLIKLADMEKLGPKVLGKMSSRDRFADTLMKLLLETEAPCSTTDTSKGSASAPPRKKTRRGSSNSR